MTDRDHSLSLYVCAESGKTSFSRRGRFDFLLKSPRSQELQDGQLRITRRQ
jgi:hypothetical protein